MPLMSHSPTEDLWQPLATPLDDAYVAHAALVVTSRHRHQSVGRAVDYLYEIADAIGVDCVELADLIVKASERRAAIGSVGSTA